ncbi:MAG: hypothetical protein GWP91_07530 [Rhodobacterales bacterium]|nr:hypothetical protein [Rhodobacterales bacterium]
MCDNGPVVVEANTGSDLHLYQFASGKGFMTPKFRSFLAQSKKTIKANSKARI